MKKISKTAVWIWWWAAFTTVCAFIGAYLSTDVAAAVWTSLALAALLGFGTLFLYAVEQSRRDYYHRAAAHRLSFRALNTLIVMDHPDGGQWQMTVADLLSYGHATFNAKTVSVYGCGPKSAPNPDGACDRGQPR